jgi:hypothetical protein
MRHSRAFRSCKKGKEIGFHVADGRGSHQKHLIHASEQRGFCGIAKEVELHKLQARAGAAATNGEGIAPIVGYAAPRTLRISYHRPHTPPIRQQVQRCGKPHVSGRSGHQDRFVALHHPCLRFRD